MPRKTLEVGSTMPHVQSALTSPSPLIPTPATPAGPAHPSATPPSRKHPSPKMPKEKPKDRPGKGRQGWGWGPPLRKGKCLRRRRRRKRPWKKWEGAGGVGGPTQPHTVPGILLPLTPHRPPPDSLHGRPSIPHKPQALFEMPQHWRHTIYIFNLSFRLANGVRDFSSHLDQHRKHPRRGYNFQLEHLVRENGIRVGEGITDAQGVPRVLLLVESRVVCFPGHTKTFKHTPPTNQLVERNGCPNPPSQSFEIPQENTHRLHTLHTSTAEKWRMKSSNAI